MVTLDASPELTPSVEPTPAPPAHSGGHERVGTERGSLASAVLCSLLAHALLLSLAFSGDEFGLTGLDFAWRERRVDAADVRLVLVPAQAAAAAPTATLGAPVNEGFPQPSLAQTLPAGSVLTVTLPDAPTLEPSSEVHVVVAQAEAPLKPSAKPVPAPQPAPLPDTASTAPAPEPARLRTEALASAAPAPPPEPALIAIDRHQEAALLVPLAPAVLTPVMSAVPSASSPQAAAQPAQQEAAPTEAVRLEAQREEAARQASARREAARLEAQRVATAQQEAERQDAARMATARQEAARQEAARLETARIETARQEAARQDAARQETQRVEIARQETARSDAQRADAARQASERQEAARQDAARQAAAQHEAARIGAALDAAKEAAARREAALRAIGQQLNEEAARREAASVAANQPPRPGAPPFNTRRGRLFGRTDANTELILYAEAWARKIQLNMTFDIVREAAKQRHTAPLVTVAIRSDGSVESVTFVLSSGVAEVDEAVRRVVQSQTPYQAFPPALAREFDVIEIRRTWHFDMAIRLY